MTTKADLDERLRLVQKPAPLIHVSPASLISTYEGYNDPYPGWYLGVRVYVDARLMDNDFWVEEFDP